MRLVVVAAVFLCAVTVLVVTGIRANSIPTVEYEALVTNPERYAGETIIVPNARIKKITKTYPIDSEAAAEGFENAKIRVVGSAPPPQNFKEELQVVLRGTYDPSTKTFDATMVTTQCPSRYSSEEAYERARASIAEAQGETSSPSLQGLR